MKKIKKVVREVNNVGKDGKNVEYVGVKYYGVDVIKKYKEKKYKNKKFENYEMLESKEKYNKLDKDRRYKENYRKR